MKWIDLPPIWLAAFVFIAWHLQSASGAWLPAQNLFGTILIIAGLLLMIAAVWEMHKQRTTVIPHLDPNALVSSGVFHYTRNPIYLGDVLVLVGLILRWDALPFGLVLIPGFIWVIHTRFIRGEEGRLRAAFGAAFDDYAKVTRRWV